MIHKHYRHISWDAYCDHDRWYVEGVDLGWKATCLICNSHAAVTETVECEGEAEQERLTRLREVCKKQQQQGES